MDFMSSYSGIGYTQDQLSMVASKEVNSASGGGWGMLHFEVVVDYYFNFILKISLNFYAGKWIVVR